MVFGNGRIPCKKSIGALKPLRIIATGQFRIFLTREACKFPHSGQISSSVIDKSYPPGLGHQPPAMSNSDGRLLCEYTRHRGRFSGNTFAPCQLPSTAAPWDAVEKGSAIGQERMISDRGSVTLCRRDCIFEEVVDWHESVLRLLPDPQRSPIVEHVSNNPPEILQLLVAILARSRCFH